MPSNICPVCGSVNAPHPAFAPFCTIKCAKFDVNTSKSKADFDALCNQKGASNISHEYVCSHCGLKIDSLDTFRVEENTYVCSTCNFKINTKDLTSYFL